MEDQKALISRRIKTELAKKGLSLDGLGLNINMKKQQIIRITGCKNYNINTLLKILDGLGLEIHISRKMEE